MIPRPHIPRRPFVVEFFGLPGSGKTTLATALHKGLQATGAEVIFSPDVTRDDLPGWHRSCARVMLILRALPRLLPILPALLRVMFWPQATHKDRIKAVFVCLTVGALLARLARQRTSAVLDQGAAQALWSCLLMCPADKDPTPLLGALRGLLPEHDWHMVILRATPGTLIQRLANRPQKHARLQTMAQRDAAQVWARATGHTECLLHRLRALPMRAGHWIELDTGHAQPAQMTQQLLAQLEHPTFHQKDM